MSTEQRLLDKLESKQRLVERQLIEINTLKKHLGGEKHKSKSLVNKCVLIGDALIDVLPHVEHILGINHPKIINALEAIKLKV